MKNVLKSPNEITELLKEGDSVSKHSIHAQKPNIGIYHQIRRFETEPMVTCSLCYIFLPSKEVPEYTLSIIDFILTK